MSASVYANGMRISGKASNNKSMGAMPDVCMSPPSPPVGPIPIPYPNFSKASKTSGGSKKVKIGGKEVGQKNKSKYISSKGNEAATRNFGMGVVSHKVSGKTQHAAWSFNVKFEGKNVIRHMDLTTHNHGSTSNLAMALDGSDMTENAPKQPDCNELQENNKEIQKEQIKDGFKEEDGSLKDGNVVATGHLKVGGKSFFVKGACPQEIIKSKHKSGFCKLKKWRGKAKTPKRVCTKKNYMRGGHGHAEAKIIEAIFEKAKKAGITPPNKIGTLTLRIQWKKEGRNRSWPCKASCQKMICEAIECGLDIKFCIRDKKEPQSPVWCNNKK